MTHDQPMRRVRGQDTSGGSGLVRAIVKRLRRKLGDDASALACFFAEPRGAVHCQPHLFHLGNSACQYKDSTKAMHSYESSSSGKLSGASLGRL